MGELDSAGSPARAGRASDCRMAAVIE